MAARVRTGDTVAVITGNDDGKRGRVLRIDREAGRILVEGVAYVQRHVRRSQKTPQGGRVQKESPVAISNVMVVCLSCDKPTRVGFRKEGEGKVRFCRRKGCGAIIN